MLKKNIVIIGSGISGITLAERFANVLNKKVIVIEKRDHIGGNCYDYINDAGILVPKYGPHYFHTNDEDVWKYVSQFTKWHYYEHRVLSCVDGKYVPIPVNIDTVNSILRLNIQTEKEMIKWLKSNCKKIDNPENSEQSALSRVGRQLYEKMFKYYTYKQWDMLPSKLSASVMNRIPVYTDHEDRYFTDKYQAMPSGGYTKLFRRMLYHPNITLQLNTDYFDVCDSRDIKNSDIIFYTGPIDRYFNNKYNDISTLQYRSLYFKHKTLNREFFQPKAQVNYPSLEFPYTRITEPKHATGQKHQKTTIIYEYSTWEGEPYYPVLSKRNLELFDNYKQKLKKEKHVYFVGRLANYKYFNMDQAFRNALDLFQEVNEKIFK